ncbi:MAG: penicillin acylase family protein [Polyangiales bacterium]
MRFRPGWFIAPLMAALAACDDGPAPAADAGRDAADDIADAPVSDASPDDVADAAVDDAPAEGDAGIFSRVPTSQTWPVQGLHGEAHVVYTAGHVPHVYARDRHDLARVQGFVTARDRYFMLDLARRYALGTLSSLLGDAALNTDLENRSAGMAFVTSQLMTAIDPEIAAVFDAYAEGINDYIAQARERAVPLPSELALAGPLLGQSNPSNLMQPFTRRDIVAMGVTFLYQSGFETGDIDRARAAQNLPGDFTGQALADLRRAGALADIWNRLAQPARVSSARVQWGTETGAEMARGIVPPGARDTAPPVVDRPANPHAMDPSGMPRVNRAALDRLADRLEHMQRRMLRDREEGFGSNAWAVMGRHTRDGATLLSADGHLGLTIPTLFYQIGLDTSVLGGGDIHQIGLTLPLIPLLAMGTNGRVAWGFTQLAGDITDWYREEIQLDATGAPARSRFNGEWRPLTRVNEEYVIANVPALMSRGRTETLPRWTTFDGRWIASVEGRTVTATETLNPGETRVYTIGGYVVPRDMDNDGTITAVSFDYVGLDPADSFKAYDGFGHSTTVDDYRRASRGLVATSLNQVAADSTGNVYYAGWQAVPCRTYLARNMDRTWAPGANPALLLDGTRYGGFTIPVTNGIIDESMSGDPYRCVVPQDRTPAARNPTRGFVVTANNEPGDITGDDDLTSEPFYIGGPWNDGYRAARIEELLGAGVTARNLDEDAMARVQADVQSPLGRYLAPVLLDAIAQARAAAEGSPAAGTPEARLAAQWTAHRADYEAVETRLRAWGTAGWPALSGVETFYHSPDAAEREASVATMIFNAWVGRFVRGVFDDERLPNGVWTGGNTSKIRTLMLMINGRGAGNSTNLASFNPATNESAYFDVLGTPEVETSREVALSALDGALTFLRAAPTAAGRGGFGTSDMTQWLWGLRHHVRFDSILTSFLGDNESLAPIANGFSITPQRLPLAMGLPMSDPRATLPGFPRPGDQWVVDAANSGLDGERHTFGSGPTYRMVIALRSTSADAMTGRNVVPGGQSAVTSSPYFDDQARLWLGNQTVPMLLSPDAVMAAATERERFVPAP